MIIRSDDLPQNVTIEQLEELQVLFEKYKIDQTMTILAGQLDVRPDFVDFVRNHDYIDLALHGWFHESYPDLDDDVIRQHLYDSMKAFMRHFDMLPKVWYLPWNGWVKRLQDSDGNGFADVPRIKRIAEEFGLEVNEVACHIKVPVDNNTYPDVAYFHFWEPNHISLLKKLLPRL